MISGPLVVPARLDRTRSVPLTATAVRIVAVLFLLASLGGALAWISQLSPLHFTRWQSIDTLHNLSVDEPGRYVLFEEGDGAADRVGPPKLALSVRSTAGRVIAVSSELDGAGRSTTTYQIPFVQGRALGSFDIDRAGKYVVLSYPVSADGTTDDPPSRRSAPDLSNMPPLALARVGEPSALGSLPGLAVVAGVPALVGATLLVIAAMVWPSPIRRSRKGRMSRTRRSDDGREFAAPA